MVTGLTSFINEKGMSIHYPSTSRDGVIEDFLQEELSKRGRLGRTVTVLSFPPSENRRTVTLYPYTVSSFRRSSVSSYKLGVTVKFRS